MSDGVELKSREEPDSEARQGEHCEDHYCGAGYAAYGLLGHGNLLSRAVARLWKLGRIR